MAVNMTNRLKQVLVALGCVCGVSTSMVQAQSTAAPRNFPNKTVRIIVGQSPGGGGDILVRLIAQKLTERFGQSFIVENIPGASGMIGMSLVARAEPDGYTYFQTSSASYNNAVLSGNASFDVRKALIPVAQLSSAPNVLSVNASLPIKSVKDLIAYSKANPGKLNYSSGGIGSSSHLNGELFKSRGGIEAEHIPHKGVGPALLDLVSGRVQFTFASATATAPHVKTGKIRAIGISSIKRSPNLPDLPTISESGLAGYDFTGWIGMMAPAGTPQAIVVAMNRPIAQTLRSPEVMKVLTADGTDPAPGTPEDLQAAIDTALSVATKLVKDLGLQLN